MGMMQVDPQALRDAASKFAQQAVSLADSIQQVTSDIDGLSGLWSSGAHTQFVDLMNQWHRDIEGVRTVLEEVARRVDNAGLGYSDLDTQIARTFQM